jgi:hypothetical protein
MGWGGAVLEAPVPGMSFGPNPLDQGGYVKTGDLLFMAGGAVALGYGVLKHHMLFTVLGLVLILLGFWSAFVPGGIGL